MAASAANSESFVGVHRHGLLKFVIELAFVSESPSLVGDRRGAGAPNSTGAGLSAPAIAAESEAIQPVLIPGGIADPDGKTAFVVGARQGLDVLKLQTGESLWVNSGVRRPLIVAGKRLVAEAPVEKLPNAIRLVVLDATRPGPRLAESENVEFPAWASIEAAPGRSFAIQSRVEGETAIVTWRADAWYAGGANISEAAMQAARKSASGEIRMALETGKIVARLDDKPRELTGAVAVRDATIGSLRLTLKESPGALSTDFGGGINRTLRATDATSGKVRWEHPIEPEVVIPGVPAKSN